MNLNNFTIKGRDTISEAVNIASSMGHQAIEPGHILKALQQVAEDIKEMKKIYEYQVIDFDIVFHSQLLIHSFIISHSLCKSFACF